VAQTKSFDLAAGGTGPVTQTFFPAGKRKAHDTLSGNTPASPHSLTLFPMNSNLAPTGDPAPFHPFANPQATVTVGAARFTVLTERLIRCEFSKERFFNDCATQTVLNRQFPLVPFQSSEEGDIFTLATKALTLRFEINEEGFKAGALTIRANDSAFEWSFETPATDDLPGTIRTLDNANGLVNMSNGQRLELRGSIISRRGWTVLEDSRTHTLNERGYLEPRRSTGDDFYFLGYGRDYASCLRDYYRLTGPVPLIPKFSLGLWWSKWWPYKDNDFLEIVGEFESHGVPLSVCVIDMDWHVVFNPHHSGWTGYTWNLGYFADPDTFLRTLHEKGVHTCLNLHPHEGVAPHERAYEAMARRLGQNPEDRKTVPFDLSDEKFLRAYFEELHHPLEKQGVDFWWIDWQQGEKCSLPGVDPLWYLNHLHATNIARNGAKRTLIFSRWGDHGSHRYPIGFVGDTFATWDTLGILPYFTSASANLGYGWRSDDIGGFQRGNHNDHELFVRWNQYACFSPIYRLHNCGDPTLDYRPWTKPAEIRDALLDAMRLRRELLPYLYTAAHTNATGGPCLCRPIYQDHPDADEAYLCPQQYLFGPDLIAAPFTTKADETTGLARQAIWLPEGTWYDFFTGETLHGGRFHVCYGDIRDIPVFARAGSAVPLLRDGKLLWRAFPGNGSSHCYDDDGATGAWKNGAYWHLQIASRLEGDRLEITSEQTGGSLAAPDTVDVEIAGQKGIHTLPRNGSITLPVSPIAATFTREKFIRCLRAFRMLAHTVRPLIGKPGVDFDGTKAEFGTKIGEILADPTEIIPYLGDFTPAQTRCLLEQITGSGFHAQPLPNNAVALCHWSDPASPCAASTTVSLRLEYSYDSFVWRKTERHTFRCVDNRSPFTSWQATTQYPDLWAFTETRPNRYEAE
jgi:alpha-glucosidase (family GH31 glycosyl hydrolase)